MHSAPAAGPVARAWLFLLLLALPLKRRLAPGLPLPARLRLGDRARRFWFKDVSELFAIEDIFGSGEYAAVAGASPSVIVDLGANAGQAALWFRTRFPKARIVSVEPDPRTFATLRRNLRGDPRTELLNAAVTAADGPVSLQRERGSSWGTRVGAGEGPRVAGLSLETILARAGIDHVDLLKVDIEGHEHEALSRSPALARTALVVGELHPELLSVPAGEAVEDMRRCGAFSRGELNGHIFVLARET
ncbi:MAG: FkbM family methyltransferase [Thermoleophilaceae bacterium]|nr:FkbM family methyltransferase [Thermoleophilaceae bacterium]